MSTHETSSTTFEGSVETEQGQLPPFERTVGTSQYEIPVINKEQEDQTSYDHQGRTDTTQDSADCPQPTLNTGMHTVSNNTQQSNIMKMSDQQTKYPKEDHLQNCHQSINDQQIGEQKIDEQQMSEQRMDEQKLGKQQIAAQRISHRESLSKQQTDSYHNYPVVHHFLVDHHNPVDHHYPVGHQYPVNHHHHYSVGHNHHSVDHHYSVGHNYPVSYHHRVGHYQRGYQNVSSTQSDRYHLFRPFQDTRVNKGEARTRIDGSIRTINQNYYPNASHSTLSRPNGNISTGAQISNSAQICGEQASTSYISGSHVVTGEAHVVGYNTLTGEERIISERVVEHEIKVPKKVVREEVIEKVIIVPETVMREEVVEEVHKIQETIIEIAKPIIQEKIIEVHEIEYRDKIIEEVQTITQEKIKEVPRIEYQERFIEIPKIIYQERLVEVPEIEYRDVIVEKVVEVPDIRENTVIKEVPIPQYIDKPFPQYVNVEAPIDIERNIPIPIETITTFEYQLAKFRPRVTKVQYPLYVPRFVEVPVSAELFDAAVVDQLQSQNNKLQILSSPQAVGLCEIQNMATEFQHNDVTSFQTSSADLQSAFVNAWKSGRIAMQPIGTAQKIITTSAHT